MVKEVEKSVSQMSDSDLVAHWNDEVGRGRQFRERFYTDAAWRRFEGYFRHRFGYLTQDDIDLEYGGNTQLDPIMVREARKMVPKIIFGIPYVRVRPLAGRTIVHSMVLERVINGVLETIHINKQLRKAVLGATIHGTAFIKTLFDSLYAPKYREVLQLGLSGGTYNAKGDRQEFLDYQRPGMPYFWWQNPRSVIWPEMITDFGEARWVAFEYLRPYADVQRDKRLKNRDSIPAMNHRLGDLDPSLQADFSPFGHVKGMCLFREIRDRETGMMWLLAEGSDKVHYKEKDVLQDVLGGRLPVHTLTFNDNLDYPFGTSDIHLIESKLRELMDTETQDIALVRGSVPYFFYQTGAVPKDELTRLSKGKARAGIECTTNPNNAILFNKMTYQGELAGNKADLERQIKAHFGTNAFDVIPQSRRGNPEVQGSQQDASISISDRQGLVRELVKEIAKDIAEMVFTFWTEETVTDILAPVLQTVSDPATGMPMQQDVTQKVWISFTGRELKGNFDFYMAPTSGRFQDQASSKQEAMELINLMGQIPGANLGELMRQLGDRFDGIDMDKVFPAMNNGGNPMQMSQLQAVLGGQGQQRLRRPDVRPLQAG
jgi:hypothetical protein